MKHRWMSILVIYNLVFLSGYIQAERGHICKEENGYVERKSLIISDFDCSDNETDGLCDLSVSAPKNIEDRNFMQFTFVRSFDGKVETYLNMQSEHSDDNVKAILYFAESSASSVTVHAVYENINGCTLQSSLNLGDLLSEQRDQTSKDKMEKLPAQ